jgi:peptidoglycan/LPS O-acetylase OafA/YrhL
MSSKIIFADRLRAVAALSVIVGHYLVNFWVFPDAVSQLTGLHAYNFDEPPLVKLLRFPGVNWGAYGVALFFIISGFVIALSFQSQGRLQFLINRFFRLYPTYLFCFVLTCAAIYFACRYQDHVFPHDLKQIAIGAALGLRDVVFWVPSIDGVVWTLEIEIKFYIICAIFSGLLRNRSLLIFLVPPAIFLAVASVGLFPILQNRYTYWIGLSGPHLIFMFAGVALHYFYYGRTSGKQTILLVGALFIGYALSFKSGLFYRPELIPTYCAALLTFVGFQIFPRPIERLRFLSFWSDISYPLYLIHGVSGYAALQILLEKGLPAIVVFPVVFATVTMIAAGVHFAIEKKSRTIGRDIARWIGQRYRSPAPAVAIVLPGKNDPLTE